MGQETLFLSLFHTEWGRKRCFFRYSIRNGAGNVVSFIIPYGMGQETLFLSLFHTEWGRKRCFFHYSIRNGAGNVVSFDIPYGMGQETLFLTARPERYLNHLRKLVIYIIKLVIYIIRCNLLDEINLISFHLVMNRQCILQQVEH